MCSQISKLTADAAVEGCLAAVAVRPAAKQTAAGACGDMPRQQTPRRVRHLLAEPFYYSAVRLTPPVRQAPKQKPPAAPAIYMGLAPGKESPVACQSGCLALSSGVQSDDVMAGRPTQGWGAHLGVP